MNQIAPKRLSFSTTHRNLQIAWDSTCLGTLKDCPRKYQLSILEGYTKSADNVHLLFGEWYHSALEKYDKLRAMGADHHEALIDTVRHTLSISMTKVYFHECHSCGMTLSLKKKHEQCPNCQSESVKITEHLKPWESDDNNKTRFTLVRTVVWYLEEFKDNPLTTLQLQDGKPAVELSFRLPLPDTAWTGESYVLCGHLDRVGLLGESQWIVDRKTTKSTISNHFFEQFTPDNQMSLYTLAGKILFSEEIKGVIIDGAQIAVNFSRFERGFADRTNEMLEEWMKDTRYWIKQAESMAREDYWPMNDKSCDKFGGCPFRGICGKSPSVRHSFLEGNFDKRFWDPLEVRN